MTTEAVVTTGEIALLIAVLAGFVLFYFLIAKATGWAVPGRLPRIRVRLRTDEYVVRRGVSAEPRGTLTLAYRMVLTNQRLFMRRERVSMSWLGLGLGAWWESRPRSRELELSSLRAVLLVEPSLIDLNDEHEQIIELRPQRFGFASKRAAGDWAASLREFAPRAASV